MFGFLLFFTIYIFWHFSNKSIAVAKCRMSFRSISSEVLSVGFWQQQDDFPGSEATEATNWNSVSTRRKYDVAWARICRWSCGGCSALWHRPLWYDVIREKCENTFHLFSSDTLIYFDTFHCTAWWLDHAWPCLTCPDLVNLWSCIKTWLGQLLSLPCEILWSRDWSDSEALLDEPFHSWAFV